MKPEYSVYTDKLKQIVEVIANLVFIVGLLWIVIDRQPHIAVSIFIGVVTILLCANIFSKIKKMRERNPLFIIDNKGIRDYTKETNGCTLHWKDVSRIELISNNTSLQIGILSTVVLQDQEEISASVRKNLVSNGNVAMYTIMIDGFQFRKKKFKEIFKEIKSYALHENAYIYVDEYKDPLQRKKESRE